MELEIITPEETLFSGAIKSARFPGASGAFEVLKNHAPLISRIEAGQIKVETAEGATEHFTVDAGFVEVRDNEIVALV